MITVSDFQEYSTLFSDAATAGIGSAQSIFEVIKTVGQVDSNTFGEFENAVRYNNKLITDLQTAYEKIFTTAFSTEPMVDAFSELSKFVIDSGVASIDEFLTNNGITVDPTFAKIANITTGSTISAGNIL